MGGGRKRNRRDKKKCLIKLKYINFLHFAKRDWIFSFSLTLILDGGGGHIFPQVLDNK